MSEAIDEVRLEGGAVHVAVDMQRVFTEPGPWFVPWMPKVLPHVAELARRHPGRTDALLTLWRQRFAQQVTTASTEEILSRWE